jgi:hypothetical protein
MLTRLLVVTLCRMVILTGMATRKSKLASNQLYIYIIFIHMNTYIKWLQSFFWMVQGLN